MDVMMYVVGICCLILIWFAETWRADAEKFEAERNYWHAKANEYQEAYERHADANRCLVQQVEELKTALEATQNASVRQWEIE